MLLDLIDTNNYVSYNIKLAHAIGLEGAVYCNQLITIQNKAQRKLKLLDNFVCVDRDYITRQTTLTLQRQLELDDVLLQLNIISKKDVNLLWVDVNNLSCLIAGDQVDFSTQLVPASVKKAQVKEAKSQAIKQNLLKSINCPNGEMREALGNWIDAVNQNPKVPPVNKMTLRKFYEDVNSYVKGEDLDLALWIINTSAAYGWREARWAIERHQKQQSNQAVQYKAREVSKGDLSY